MSLNNIECTCPQCGAEFTLDKAIEERALAKVQEEFDALNDKHVQEKIEAAELNALNKGKELAQKDILAKAKEDREKFDEISQKLVELELAKENALSEKQRLEREQEAKERIALEKQKRELEAQQAHKTRLLEEQISTLTSDVQKATSRAEQASMQSQGEAAELIIEDALKAAFPQDDVVEVKKGQKGADCILVVKNNAGRAVGKINIESKQTKNFSNDWIGKLKNDSISINAHFSVLITTAWPNDNNKAHQREGVWVCGFSEYMVLIRALRNSLIEIANVAGAEAVREEKAQIMFDFLTSQEFAGSIEQMIRPITRMQEQLNKEKRAMNGIWKEREALINGSITGAENLYFKIQGIAQVNLPKITGIETIDLLSSD